MSSTGSIFNVVLAAVITLAETQQSYAPIQVGALPADNGISICITAGSPVLCMDKGAQHELTLALNAKHSSQETVLMTLGKIHEMLTAYDYPLIADGCQITSIETLAAPSYLDREERQWLYGSSLRVKFYKPKG